MLVAPRQGMRDWIEPRLRDPLRCLPARRRRAAEKAKASRVCLYLQRALQLLVISGSCFVHDGDFSANTSLSSSADTGALLGHQLGQLLGIERHSE